MNSWNVKKESRMSINPEEENAEDNGFDSSVEFLWWKILFQLIKQILN